MSIFTLVGVFTSVMGFHDCLLLVIGCHNCRTNCRTNHRQLPLDRRCHKCVPLLVECFNPSTLSGVSFLCVETVNVNVCSGGSMSTPVDVASLYVRTGEACLYSFILSIRAWLGNVWLRLT